MRRRFDGCTSCRHGPRGAWELQEGLGGGYFDMEHVLLTGFPGFLAENLVSRCQEEQLSVFWHFVVLPEELGPASQKLRVLGLTSSQCALYPGDITKPNLGLPAQDIQSLQAQIERCFHLAALYDLTASAAASQAANVLGTRHVVQFLMQCPKLKRLNYVSTCYVSGSLEGEIAEDALAEPAAFHNEYERTKHEAEKVVRASMDRLPTTVFRPSVVVGDSQTGQTGKFDGPYVLISFLKWARYLAPRMPNLGFQTTRFNCVPVDFVTQVVKEVGFSDEFVGKTMQVADPNPPTTAESFKAICLQATGRGCFDVGEGFKKSVLGLLHRFPFDLITGIPIQSLDYFHHRGAYRTDNLQAACRRFGIPIPKWADFYKPMIRFAMTEQRGMPNAAAVNEFKTWCSCFRFLYAVTGLAFLLAPSLVCHALTALDAKAAADLMVKDNLLWRTLAVSYMAGLFVAVTSLEHNPFIKPPHIMIIGAKLTSTVLFFAYAAYLGLASLVVCGVIDGVIALFHLLFYFRLRHVREMAGGTFRWDPFHMLFPDRFVLAFTEAMAPDLEDPIDVRTVAEGIHEDVRKLPFQARWAFILMGHYASLVLPCLFGYRPFHWMNLEQRRQFLRRVQHAPQGWSKLPLMFAKLVCTNRLFRQAIYLHSIGAP
jgi:nucleoside-diphosphate-sugar epimerase